MIERENLKKIIVSQNKFTLKRITPREHLKTLKNKSDSDFIIIISGIRRCGKSVLLNMLRETQKESKYYFNFDDERLHNFTVEDFNKLYESFIELYGKENTFYFDEIQNINGWERFVRRLHNQNSKVYITGSNATLLSKELGTKLTGRYIQIELYPLSFKEYLKYENVNIGKIDPYEEKDIFLLKKQFSNYLKNGGFIPYLDNEDEDFFKYLYESIIYRDVISRYNLKFDEGVKDIVFYLISNIGKEFSYTSLKKVSAISSVTTIKEYVKYLENSYLIFSLRNYDFSLKKQLVNPKKVYCIDNALAASVSFQFSENKGRMLENTVFLELKRRGQEIYYYKNKHECDFVIKEKNKIVKAIQVTLEFHNKNKEREIKGLLEAMNKFNLKEGLILTYDQEKTIKKNNKTIKIRPVWNWLIKN